MRHYRKRYRQKRGRVVSYSFVWIASNLYLCLLNNEMCSTILVLQLGLALLVNFDTPVK